MLEARTPEMLPPPEDGEQLYWEHREHVSALMRSLAWYDIATLVADVAYRDAQAHGWRIVGTGETRWVPLWHLDDGGYAYEAPEGREGAEADLWSLRVKLPIAHPE